MPTECLKRSPSSSLLSLLVLSTVALGSCCKKLPPPQPPRVITVTETCQFDPVPTLAEIQSCLGQAPTDARTMDCFAHAVLVREVWITAAVARCGQ